ncbi:hypothetical protein NUU61_009762 [Penicillium alfredii]|uniref:Amine oxidase domain-containing protein n=1 Tax=Penicillium alfredii TaxID=1506179 RepID=A0A9W9EGQ7_9EURO|nr:uncharacterized protein NUU61_009762 [Penicillium alfredii]KAJ5081498.1 hypothetical protein NUU61_009762 [Penicillium alfredii]
MDPQSSQPRSVAVVGTGMAGLVTAHLLHQDPQKRYRVTLLEKRDQISLSAESIAIHSQDEKNSPLWADVPMRAFAGGFYRNLIQMYDYLGVRYHAQSFLFSFTKLPRKVQEISSSPLKPSPIPGPRMVYASNFHQIPPIPRTMDLVQWLLEAAYALLFYCWFTICCFFVAPFPEDPQNGTPSESLDHYLRRVWLPQSYVTDYLLPLVSSVCTCSHEEMLRFPASDVLEYKRRTHHQQHYVVSSGVQSVQGKLLKGIDVRLGVDLTHVLPQPDGVHVNYSGLKGQTVSEHFDMVVLAVSPDIAAKLFAPLQAQLTAIPTTSVETVAHTDTTSVEPMLRATGSFFSNKLPLSNATNFNTQRIHLLSTDSTTESVHEQSNSILVTTNPLFPVNKAKVIRSARFTRVLRDSRSRLIVNSIFRDRSQSNVPSTCDSSYAASSSWRSGDDGVYLAGGWCWDGMVLLEGCIVSAMRVAADLDVRTPWDNETR